MWILFLQLLRELLDVADANGLRLFELVELLVFVVCRQQSNCLFRFCRIAWRSVFSRSAERGSMPVTIFVCLSRNIAAK